jgi:hypothetical protein
LDLMFLLIDVAKFAKELKVAGVSKKNGKL